jgi:hypothetical protein
LVLASTGLLSVAQAQNPLSQNVQTEFALGISSPSCIVAVNSIGQQTFAVTD